MKTAITSKTEWANSAFILIGIGLMLAGENGWVKVSPGLVAIIMGAVNMKLRQVTTTPLSFDIAANAAKAQATLKGLAQSVKGEKS